MRRPTVSVAVSDPTTGMAHVSSVSSQCPAACGARLTAGDTASWCSAAPTPPTLSTTAPAITTSPVSEKKIRNSVT